MAGWVTAPRTSGGPAGPVEVLVVDDNADMRSHLVRVLSPHWRVHAAADGREALEFALQNPPELVLTDVMMPRLNGFGLLAALREHQLTRDVPVVMVSARAGTEAIIDGLDGGADDYLVKPFTTAELLARVRTQLATARQRLAAATRLQLLSDITHELNSSLEPGAVAATLTRHLVPAYGRTLTVNLHESGPDSPAHPLSTAGENANEGPDPRTGGRLVLPLEYRGERIGSVELTGVTGAAGAGLEHPFLAAVIDRAALALHNATSYQHEYDTALNLQTAMLTDLPAIPGLPLAAHYRPAAARDLVGGDWYDAFVLPTTNEAGTSVALTIGDITGHDIHAAALMGQIRNMLRQAVLDHPTGGPAAAVSAVEHACAHLPLHVSGTLVHGRLHHNGDGTWTKVGHPYPLVLNPDLSVDQLRTPGILMFPGLPPRVRQDYQRILPPGSTLLLFTDGLVDRPDSNYTDDVAAAERLLAEFHDKPLPDLLHALATRIPGTHPSDDTALMAIRIP